MAYCNKMQQRREIEQKVMLKEIEKGK